MSLRLDQPRFRMFASRPRHARRRINAVTRRWHDHGPVPGSTCNKRCEQDGGVASGDNHIVECVWLCVYVCAVVGRTKQSLVNEVSSFFL